MANPVRTAQLGRPSFICPHCGSFAQQQVAKLQEGAIPASALVRALAAAAIDEPADVLETLRGLPAARTFVMDDWYSTTCNVCEERAIWNGLIMVFPAGLRGASPEPAMPREVQDLYEEARSIAGLSPRAAGTLLRVALETLVENLVEGGGTLNSKIGVLVTKGMSPRVQRAMDTMRVFGNDGAHAAALDLADTTERTDQLFSLINIIVRQVITEPAAVDALYDSLPPEKLNGIARRDGG